MFPLHPDCLQILLFVGEFKVLFIRLLLYFCFCFVCLLLFVGLVFVGVVVVLSVIKELCKAHTKLKKEEKQQQQQQQQQQKEAEEKNGLFPEYKNQTTAVPMFQNVPCIKVPLCPRVKVPLYTCTMYRSVKVPLYGPCIKVPLYACIKVPLYPCIKIPLYPCISVPMCRVLCPTARQLLRKQSRQRFIVTYPCGQCTHVLTTYPTVSLYPCVTVPMCRVLCPTARQLLPKQSRQRFIVTYAQNGGLSCPSTLSEERQCLNLPVCETYYWDISDWSDCILPPIVPVCGDGLRARSKFVYTATVGT